MMAAEAQNQNIESAIERRKQTLTGELTYVLPNASVSGSSLTA
jgi:hypothetical protein